MLGTQSVTRNTTITTQASPTSPAFFTSLTSLTSLASLTTLKPKSARGLPEGTKWTFLWFTEGHGVSIKSSGHTEVSFCTFWCLRVTLCDPADGWWMALKNNEIIIGDRYTPPGIVSPGSTALFINHKFWLLGTRGVHGYPRCGTLKEIKQYKNTRGVW